MGGLRRNSPMSPWPHVAQPTRHARDDAARDREGDRALPSLPERASPAGIAPGEAHRARSRRRARRRPRMVAQHGRAVEQRRRRGAAGCLTLAAQPSPGASELFWRSSSGGRSNPLNLNAKGGPARPPLWRKARTNAIPPSLSRGRAGRKTPPRVARDARSAARPHRRGRLLSARAPARGGCSVSAPTFAELQQIARKAGADDELVVGAQGALQPHRLANVFPPMHPDQFRALVEDIRRRGQQTPICVFENQILDGRQRALACKELGIEPRSVEYAGSDPLAFVISANLHRRHLRRVAAGARGGAYRDAREGREPACANLRTLPGRSRRSRQRLTPQRAERPQSSRPRCSRARRGRRAGRHRCVGRRGSSRPARSGAAKGGNRRPLHRSESRHGDPP